MGLAAPPLESHICCCSLSEPQSSGRIDASDFPYARNTIKCATFPPRPDILPGPCWQARDALQASSVGWRAEVHSLFLNLKTSSAFRSTAIVQCWVCDWSRDLTALLINILAHQARDIWPTETHFLFPPILVLFCFIVFLFTAHVFPSVPFHSVLRPAV